MQPARKKALHDGRHQAAVVRRYLHSLAEQAAQPRRPSRSTIEQRLEEIETALADEREPVRRLQLIQQRLDQQHQLAAMDGNPTDDHESIEAEFKAVAATYASRKGISYFAFREAGVPARVLTEAGVSR